MISLIAPFVAAGLLFGLSTYFGVFVLETFLRKGELQREAEHGSASQLRAGGRWLAPAVWVLTVWVLALFIGYFVAVGNRPPTPPGTLSPDKLPLPAIWGAPL